MSNAQDPTENAYILSCNTPAPSQNESLTRKRKMSSTEPNDKVSSPGAIDSQHLATNAQSAEPEHDKSTYNGPQMVHVVMLRVANESSARPMPQSAFFSRETALSFAAKILLQWCEAHYEDFHWKGPEVLTKHCVERYAAYDAQTGAQLAAVDVVKVSIFDAKDDEDVSKKNQKNDEVDVHVGCDDVPEKNQNDDSEDGQAGWAQDQPVALEQYPREVVDKVAAEAVRSAMSANNGICGWSEDSDMRVFGGYTE